MVKPLRLQKYIADCGICSRRKAEDLISSGQVAVNGVVATLGSKILPTDKVTINGKAISITSKETYLLYKPIGYTSSTEDRFAVQLVTELIPDSTTRLYPIGRLDKNSEGLIILTNDGNLTHHASHPKFTLNKVYEVHITPPFREADRKILEQGIIHEEEKLTLDKLTVLKPKVLQITLHHGKKRHIRRMLAQCHYHVDRLIRTHIGPFSLATLNNKPHIKLSEEQTKKLIQT